MSVISKSQLSGMVRVITMLQGSRPNHNHIGAEHVLLGFIRGHFEERLKKVLKEDPDPTLATIGTTQTARSSR